MNVIFAPSLTNIVWRMPIFSVSIIFWVATRILRGGSSHFSLGNKRCSDAGCGQSCGKVGSKLFFFIPFFCLLVQCTYLPFSSSSYYICFLFCAFVHTHPPVLVYLMSPPFWCLLPRRTAFSVFLLAGPLLSIDCTKYPFTMACRYSFLFAVKRSYLHIDIQAKIMNCKQNGGESVAHVADPKPALCPQRSTPGVRAWAFDKQCYSVLGKYISTFWFSINKL